MTKTKKIGIIGVVAFLTLIVFIGVKLNQPAYEFTLDVNPSIQIVSSRLNKVLQVNPLNEDAKQMLKDFKIEDNDLEDTIEDIADLMVLTGYISGGKDNFVMITVEDKDVDSKYVDRVNNAIAAYLENKQLEATIINQTISEEMNANSTGRELVAHKINEIDDDLTLDDLSSMTIKDLIEIAAARGISPEELFSNVLAAKNGNNVEEATEKTSYIGEAKAKEIALGLVNGQIVEFKLDEDDDDEDDNPEYKIEILANGYKYEIELDAYTGKVLEFEKDDYDDSKAVSNKGQDSDDDDDHRDDDRDDKSKSRISMEKAREIALDRTNGGSIKEADHDDDGFEFEIINNGYEYEVDLDQYGNVIKFEKDLIDDDDDDRKASSKKPKSTPVSATTAPTSAPTTAQTKTAKTRITMDEAKAIALDKTGGGKIVDAEQDDDEFEFKIINNSYEYEIEMNQYGDIIDFDKELMDDDD